MSRSDGDPAQQAGHDAARTSLLATHYLTQKPNKVGKSRGTREIRGHSCLGPGDDLLRGLIHREHDEVGFRHALGEHASDLVAARKGGVQDDEVGMADTRRSLKGFFEPSYDPNYRKGMIAAENEGQTLANETDVRHDEH